MPRQLTNLRIDEVSSVDRGAGKGVRVLLMKRQGDEPYWKREFSADERRSAAESGAALPDGSFPIKNKKDLSNAIQAIGRAKDRGRAMAHIKSRARALGATDMLPDSWSKRDDAASKALALAVGSILSDGGEDRAQKLIECFKQYHGFLNGDEQENDMPLEITKEQLDELIKTAVADSLEKLGKAKKPATPENENEVEEGDEPDATGGGDSAAGDTGKNMNMSDDDAKKFLQNLGISVGKKDKPDPVKIELAKRDAEIIDLRKTVKEMTERQQREDFAKRAVDLGLAKDDGEKLRKAYSGDVDSLRWMEDTIRKLQTQVEKAGLFSEIGDARGATGATAHDELMAKAKEIRKADSKLTEAQAYVKAMEDNPEIAKREAVERSNKIMKLAP